MRARDRAVSAVRVRAVSKWPWSIVARGDLETAQDVLRQGVVGQDRPARTSDRFPAIGFHWLSGVVRAARGDEAGAIDEFDLELSQVHPDGSTDPSTRRPRWCRAATPSSRLVSPIARARRSRAALTHIAGYGRALVGLSLAECQTIGRCGRVAAAREATPRGHRTITSRRAARTRRMVVAHATPPPTAIPPRPSTPWNALLASGPPSVLGWTLPVEPFFRPLIGQPGFARVLARLAERAR